MNEPGTVPRGVLEAYRRQPWRALEDGLLSIEREIRLLERATPRALIALRDRAIDEPRYLAQLEQLTYEPIAQGAELRRALERAREALLTFDEGPLRRALAGRIDELDLELELGTRLGGAAVRERIAARYQGTLALSASEALASEWAEVERPEQELSEAGDLVDFFSFAQRRLAEETHLRVVSRPLLSRAAAAEGVLFVREGLRLPRRVAERTLAHELAGHLLVRERAKTLGPPFRVGCAYAWMDEEGRAISLEERRGLSSPERRAELALGYRIGRQILSGATPLEVFALEAHGPCSRDVLITSICRAARGGGLCREVGYLLGYVRVRDAVAAEPAVFDWLGYGRLSVEVARELFRGESPAANHP